MNRKACFWISKHAAQNELFHFFYVTRIDFDFNLLAFISLCWFDCLFFFYIKLKRKVELTWYLCSSCSLCCKSNCLFFSWNVCQSICFWISCSFFNWNQIKKIKILIRTHCRILTEQIKLALRDNKIE